MYVPDPIPGSPLAQVDCMDCGAYTLAIPERASLARCEACWTKFISEIMATVRAEENS